MSKGIEGSNPSLTASFLVKSRSEFDSASSVVTSGTFRPALAHQVSMFRLIPAFLCCDRPFEVK
ncbi:MAG: hypothetical protein VXW45_01645 [Pseudomonadota bacterium]|nr:hypothetical protein [Pseudomonadota bacterium]